MAHAGERKGVPPTVPLLGLGVIGIVVLVVGAVALRAPLNGTEALAASFDAAQLGSAQAPIPSESPPVTLAPDRPTVSALQQASAPSRDGQPSSTRELKKKFDRDVNVGNHRAAVADIDAIMSQDPTAADDRELRDQIVELAMRIMVGGGPECDELFAVISERMGTHGIDMLYELVTTRGGSRAARRAEDLLKDPAVLARGSDAMRIAYDLRASSCEQKPTLFERAKTDGDGRAYGLLVMMNQECSRRSGTCCLHNDPRLKETLAALRARLPQ